MTNQSKENSQGSNDLIYNVLNVMAWIMNAIIVGVVIYAGWIGWEFLNEVILFTDH